MTTEPAPTPMTPFHDPRTSHAERLAWLERSLRDQEPLPTFEAGEYPAVAWIRVARSLPHLHVEHLRRGVRELVERYAIDPQREADDAYVSELLALIPGLGLGLTEVGPALTTLWSTPERALAMPIGQAQRVLATLVDLRAPVSEEALAAWVQRAPERVGVLALTHALRMRPGDVQRALRALPDHQGVADATWATFKGHAERLTVDERAALATSLGSGLDGYAPAIRAAVQEWLTEQPATVLDSTRLDAALSARQRQRQRGTVYARDPATPKLHDEHLVTVLAA